MPWLKRTDYTGFVPALASCEFGKAWRVQPPEGQPCRAGASSSRRARSAQPGVEKSSWELLGPLWCRVAQYGNVAQCGALLQANVWICEVFSEDAVWRFHAVAAGFVRPAGPAAAPAGLPPGDQAGQAVDWRRLLRANLVARRKPWVWVNVDGSFVRVPLPPERPLSLKALVGLVTDVTRDEPARTLAAPAEAPPAAVRPRRRRCPLRLRWLQWGGRPGALVRDGALLAGASIQVEWLSSQMRGWPLPPEKPVELGSCGQPPQAAQAMLRIKSLLAPAEIWMTVDRDAAVGELFKEMARVLRQQCPLLSDMGRPVQFRLMDALQTEGALGEASACEALVPEQAPLGARSLQDVFWAQSETVRVELESAWSDEAQVARSASPTRGAAGRAVRLLVWRQATFEAAEAPGSPRWAPAPEGSVPAPAAWGAGHMRRRPGGGAAAGGRASPLQAAQRREEGLLSLPHRLFETASEFSPTLAAGTSLWRCSSPSSSGHPGDIAVDCPELSGDEREAVGTSGLCWERVVPHYAPRLLPQTLRTRQFEFHPSLHNVILTGDKKGCVNVVDLDRPELHPHLTVGVCPVLGLAWLRHHPQIAACGASNSGKITFLKYEPGMPKTEPALSFKQSLEEFPKLSSLSTNCTDDFMLVSGISPNLAVYDVQTGKVLVKASNVHEHFINISRFCNTNPHVFATSSFDHTCKVWDLRRPILHDRPVKTLVTGGQNVMCTFSPDDKHILCSGVDTRLSQFETSSWHQWPERFPLREPLHRERYRRSIYTASGQHFVTAATEESHMHLMSVSGKKLGVVDFRGVIKDQAPLHRAPRSPASATRGALVKGSVQLDDADPNGGSSRNNHEFVQSIRAHPELNNRFGVLLTLATGEQSYVAVVDVDRRALLSVSL